LSFPNAGRNNSRIPDPPLCDADVAWRQPSPEPARFRNNGQRVSHWPQAAVHGQAPADRKAVQRRKITGGFGEAAPPGTGNLPI